ncbi:hypothetical protein [Actinacidiphila oryziradicis]|nr:hypothetical protein [Actinacidiphila oryziradicis]
MPSSPHRRRLAHSTPSSVIHDSDSDERLLCSCAAALTSMQTLRS